MSRELIFSMKSSGVLTNWDADRCTRGANDNQFAVVVKPANKGTHGFSVGRGAEDDPRPTYRLQPLGLLDRRARDEFVGAK